MGRGSSVAAATVLVALLAGPARAQSVRGRLVDSVNRQPVVSALAELRDAAGKVQQVFTSPSGAFTFVVAPNQHYQLRVAAVGFARHVPVDVAVATGPVVVPDLLLTAVAVSLPELRALSGKRACGSSDLNADTFGGLLDGAHTSLQVMDATLKSAQLGFEVQLIHTITVRKYPDTTVSADTANAGLRDWPIRSLSIDSLRAFGFQRPKSPEEGTGHHYYGPDMQVLFSDWFLDNHCFSLDKDRSKGDTVVIKFDPTGKVKNVDISGELVLDRASLTMRRLTYALRNLPDGLPDRSAGGEMEFAEKSPGLWVPVEWAIWAPYTKSQRLISRPVLLAPVQRGGLGSGTASPMNAPPPPPPPLVQVVGRDEQRGRLLRIVPLGG